MAHRTLITFPDAQFEQLRALSQRTGAPIAELVRRAVAATYSGETDAEKARRLATLDTGLGAWAERKQDPFATVRRQWPTAKEWKEVS